jgi:hypothetical protein
MNHGTRYHTQHLHHKWICIICLLFIWPLWNEIPNWNCAFIFWIITTHFHWQYFLWNYSLWSSITQNHCHILSNLTYLVLSFKQHTSRTTQAMTNMQNNVPGKSLNSNCCTSQLPMHDSTVQYIIVTSNFLFLSSWHILMPVPASKSSFQCLFCLPLTFSTVGI